MTSSSYQALGMTAFLAQPDLESQVEYLRFRFSNIRFKAFVLGLALLYQSLFFSFYHFFYTEIWVSNCLILLLNKQNTNQPSSQLNQRSCAQLLAKVSNFCERRRIALCRSLNSRLQTNLKNILRR